MTTISVTDDVRERLLRIASELQIKLRRRINMNEAIQFLIDEREKRRQLEDPRLLEEACKSIPGSEEALKELYAEREFDEKRLERKTSAGH